MMDAGASEEKARAAARALATYDNRFVQIDNRFSQIDNHFTQIEGSLALVKWMLGFNLAISVALLFRVFS